MILIMIMLITSSPHLIRQTAEGEGIPKYNLFFSAAAVVVIVIVVAAVQQSSISSSRV